MDLRAALEAGLWPAGSTPAAIAKRTAGLRSLWPRLAKERGIVAEGSTHYSFRREEAEAYAAYYLPANALKVALVLEEAFLRGNDAVPGGAARWLDIGTGPGTAFWGAAWWFSHRRKQLSFTGWDQSPLFAEIASGLARARPFGAAARFFSPGKGEKWESLLRKENITHLSFVNSIAEIYPDLGARKNAVAATLDTLRKLRESDGKPRYLLIVEPGSRESSRELAELKDFLQAEKKGRVLLPCLDARPCGALRDPRDWCHEEASCEFPEWMNELGSGVGLRKESMLFSYALMEAADPAQAFRAEARIVSQRMERKGQVECRLCLPEGKVPARVQRSKATPQNSFVLDCVRGDFWENTRLGEKNDVEEAGLFQSSIPSLFGN